MERETKSRLLGKSFLGKFWLRAQVSKRWILLDIS